ncbi:washc3 [Symbiodinium sp. KB8]|nr:washc3 [Symbiodinium sp. KB8]
MASTALATVGEDAATEHVPIKTTQLLVNAFITDTVAFLNSFSAITESKLQAMGGNIARLEKNLILLEHKLARIPGLTDIAEGQHARMCCTALGAEVPLAAS